MKNKNATKHSHLLCTACTAKGTAPGCNAALCGHLRSAWGHSKATLPPCPHCAMAARFGFCFTCHTPIPQ